MLPNCVCQLPATLQQIKNHIFHSILELVSNEIVKHEEYLTVSLLTKINIMINMKLELSMKHKKKKMEIVKIKTIQTSRPRMCF